jgi:TldD protein
MKPSRVFLLVLFSLALAVDLQAASKTVATAKADPLLTTMQRELQRASAELAKSQPAPYYLSYTVRDQDATFVAAGQGAIISSIQARARLGDVVTRVGSPTLDNSHNSSRGSALMTGQIPLDDDDAAITRTLWQLTNRGYLRASRAFLQLKT